MKELSYQEKSVGARYVVTREGYAGNKILWRIWDRQEKKFFNSIVYGTKRAAQNVIDGDE